MELMEHTSRETAYVVDDYPYGFRLRTQIRYWIETKPGHGQRFVSQTVNPKTGKWNKPKPSIYSGVMALYLDEDAHVTYDGIGGWSSEEKIAAFETASPETAAMPYVRERIRYLRAANRAAKRFTVTIDTSSDEPGQTIQEQGKMLADATRYELWQETLAAIHA